MGNSYANMNGIFNFLHTYWWWKLGNKGTKFVNKNRAEQKGPHFVQTRVDFSPSCFSIERGRFSCETAAHPFGPY